MNLNRSRAGLYLVCIARAGYRDGASLIEFIEQWRRVVELEDGPINIEQFIARNRRYSRRSTFRLLRLFRDTFPELGREGLPDQLMGPLIARLAREVDPA